VSRAPSEHRSPLRLPRRSTPVDGAERHRRARVLDRAWRSFERPRPEGRNRHRTRRPQASPRTSRSLGTQIRACDNADPGEESIASTRFNIPNVCSSCQALTRKRATPRARRRTTCRPSTGGASVVLLEAEDRVGAVFEASHSSRFGSLRPLAGFDAPLRRLAAQLDVRTGVTVTKVVARTVEPYGDVDAAVVAVPAPVAAKIVPEGTTARPDLFSDVPYSPSCRSGASRRASLGQDGHRCSTPIRPPRVSKASRSFPQAHGGRRPGGKGLRSRRRGRSPLASSVTTSQTRK
jgi:hypothetical protein